jgi:hypothetical protein
LPKKASESPRSGEAVLLEGTKKPGPDSPAGSNRPLPQRKDLLT